MSASSSSSNLPLNSNGNYSPGGFGYAERRGVSDRRKREAFRKAGDRQIDTALETIERARAVGAAL